MSYRKRRGRKDLTQSAWEKKFIMGFSVPTGAVFVTEGGMRNITGGPWIPGVRGAERKAAEGSNFIILALR